MAHLQQREFCRRVKERYPRSFAGKLVLDIGALDVNGSNKALFEECLYLGVDIGSGPNVDIVSVGHELALPDATFDTIISTECFEHDRYYPKTLANIVRMLKPGGLFLFSCATEGRPEHGTRRSAPKDAPLLHGFGDWEDYYKNLTEADIRAALPIDEVFPEHQFIVHAAVQDLYFCGVKAGEAKVRTDYSCIDHDKKVQLYRDTGDGFVEAGSTSQMVLAGPAGGPSSQAREFRFELGAPGSVRAIRLDPFNASAVVEIEKLALISGTTETNVIPWMRTNAVAVDGNTWFFETSDPQILLEGVDPKVLAKAEALVARIRYLEVGEAAAPLARLARARVEADVAASALKQTHAELAQNRALLAEVQSQAAERLSALDGARATLSTTQASLATTQAALVSTQAQLARAGTASQALTTQLAQAQGEAKATKAALVDTQSSLKKAQAQAKSATAAAAEAGVELGAARVEARRLGAELGGARQALEALRASLGWRLTAPLRRVDHLVRDRFSGFGRFELVPLAEVEKVRGLRRDRFRSTGADPQFWLQPERMPPLPRGGWFTVEFDFRCDRAVRQQLFIDWGHGYQDAVSLKFTVEKSGPVRLPIFLPRTFKGLRLDPMAEPGEFSIRDLRLVHSRVPLSGTPDHNRVNRHLQLLEGIGFHLEPLRDVAADGSGGKHWNATGGDPSYLVRFDDSADTLSGWHRVELKLRGKEPQAIAKFYFDTGHGFSEGETLVISYESGQLAERIFLIDRPIHAVRFDPQEGTGPFELDSLKLLPLTEPEAVELMARRLSSSHAGYRGRTTDEVLTQVAALAKVDRGLVGRPLRRIYDSTFTVEQTNLDYEQWIDQVERKTLPTRDAATARLTRLKHRPLISIVTPVYNTPAAYLRACLDSALAQSYPNWEFCLADDKSPDPEVRKVLEEYAARDRRFKVTFRTENGHISRASNSALELATGEWVALLDHDDVLAEHALWFVACGIDERPDAKIFYSDEDKLNAQGRRFEPHFKSDWNPDLFFSNNYVSHLGVYRRDLLEKIGGFRTGVEGSQDQDLLLRCLPHVEDDQIVHIPRVLYHWRAVEGSTAATSDSKSYTIEAGIKSLRDYFASVGREVTVAPGVIPNTYRVQYAIPDPAPLVSLLIPTRDQSALLIACVESILGKTTYPNFEVLILDNGSVEPAALKFLEEIPKRDARVRVLAYNHPFNFSSINNFGVQQARGEIIGMINNDIEVIGPEWLTEMVSHACRPEIGCVGAKLYYSNDTLQHGGVIVGLGGVANHSHKHFPREHAGYFARLVVTQNFSAVTAACAVVRKSVYLEVGGLDEKNLKVAFNDVDFCLKVREAGYRNLWTPYAELYHHESISRGAEDNPEKVARFKGEVEFMMRKWAKALVLDPFYSPNLTRDRQDFSISGN